uniref:cAMP-dependent protein kinase catalytic subunit alpha n=1 Tax=Lygus hesperus TaxID=30085 RepID=A0A0A9VYG3_LYGHE
MVKTFLATGEIPSGDALPLVPEGHFTTFQSHIEFAKYLMTEKNRFTKDYNRKSCCSSDLSQYELIKTIGKGAFGTVFLAKSKKYNNYLVVKCLSKEDIIGKNLLKQVLNEKRIMSTIKFNFVLNIMETFIDNSFVYFAMPFLCGGDLLGHLLKEKRFEEPATKYYVAQVVLALEYLHSLKIAHRDLKPENLSLDQRGYLRLLDFGLSKIVIGKTYTFCGTPEYMAPEIILGKGYGFSVDWWSLGVVAYQLCSGIQPFFSSKQDRLFSLITSGEFTDREFFSDEFSDFLSKLMAVDVTCRVGCGQGGAGEVKKQKWFEDINWLALLNKRAPIPYKPNLENFGLTNFNHFAEEAHVVASQNTYRDFFGDF